MRRSQVATSFCTFISSLSYIIFSCLYLFPSTKSLSLSPSLFLPETQSARAHTRRLEWQARRPAGAAARWSPGSRGVGRSGGRAERAAAGLGSGSDRAAAGACGGPRAPGAAAVPRGGGGAGASRERSSLWRPTHGGAPERHGG